MQNAITSFVEKYSLVELPMRTYEPHLELGAELPECLRELPLTVFTRRRPATHGESYLPNIIWGVKSLKDIFDWLDRRDELSRANTQASQARNRFNPCSRCGGTGFEM